ncbi:centromere protein J isoform X2 [Xiphias gladius]|uniref:centromere protein J isoform X2 n=1 Tax=Xiphias gladius TaxID=8245 RepID=UPI001A99A22D|nr:centromere protein J isoform X2 [Xiphias gladius]
MSSPTGVQYSQLEFLARWMPSSSRAGVILNPSTDLAGSLRHSSAVGSPPQQPDDSFASDFAPLPASADSSCHGVDGFARLPGGERAGTDRPVNGLYSVPTRNSDGQLDSLDEMASKSQDLPLMMKLEQLRKWQQHMQEQLKAHQLEELLCLQEEQQRLLGMMNGSQLRTGDHSESPGLSGARWEENSLQEASHHRESPNSPTGNCSGIPQDSTYGLQQEQTLSPAARRERLPRGQNHGEMDDKDGGIWNSRDYDQELDDTLIPSNGVALTEDHARKKDKISEERPIKPGIGGHKQTFEELLEEQLRLEEQRLKSARQQQSQDGAEDVQVPPKRAFLKRGEGLSRFTNNRKASLPKKEVKKDCKPQPQARIISRSNSEPAAIQKGGTNCIQRLPVQRKTAILNKENRLRSLSSPPQDIRAESKAARMKVLGSHQRQNTEGPESIQTYPEGRQTRQCQLGQVKEQNNRTVGLSALAVRKPGSHNMQPNPVTKQVGMLEGPGKAEDYAAKEKNCGSKVESVEGRMGSEGEEEGDGVPMDSFELSFQEKLQRWECNRQLESMELGEFELLEQAAEELSFSSNSSFVMKVLQMDQQHQQLQAVRGHHLRRLSSTPIKSPPRGALQRCSSVGSGGDLARRSSSVNSEAFVVKIKDDALKNKVSTEDREGQDSGTEDKQENSDVSSCGGSEFEDQGVAVKPPLFPSTLYFPSQSNPPYDKRSYQDEDSCRASDATQDGDGEGDSVLSDADESTLIGDKDGQQGRVVFDDDDTWNDLEETPVNPAGDSGGVSPVSKATANGASPPERTLLRKVAVSKVVALDKGTVIGSGIPEPATPPPPASQLMTRLFPSLKPKAQNVPLPPPATSVAPGSKKPEEETGQQVQSRRLRERLVELEIEIERFRKENAALAKLRQENEKNQENLRKERLEFEQTKAEELAKFEEYRKDENKKLQKERKLFEKHASAARTIPDKKEREEIQVLKQQLSSLQEELRRKESRWACTHSRLRQQIDSLSQENSSLRDEVRMLEKLRLNAWKKFPVSAEKDKETKDGPKIFANSVSSVTKGVKFASPLESRGSSSSPPWSSTAAASRRSSGDSSTTGMKSSLRRPLGPSTSSSSLPGRRTEERSTPASESQDKPPNQEQSANSFSPKRDSLPKEPERSETEEAESAQEVITHPDGKIEKVLAGGDRLIIFPNGTRKEVSADGLTVRVTFFNGDTKQITADQRVIYYYSDAQTTHITYPDGLEVLHFSNNQTEKHFPDGRKEITFPDQTVKNLFPDGREESVLTDGTIIQVNPDGTKEIHFNTGQKETHTADYKRREYPDGTVKTVYADGRQETRYPTGRLRIKDKDGNVILDNRA